MQISIRKFVISDKLGHVDYVAEQKIQILDRLTVCRGGNWLGIIRDCVAARTIQRKP
jgi:hypothetical protein